MACSHQSTLNAGGKPFTFTRQSAGDRLGDPHALFLHEVQLAPDESVERLGDAWDPWVQWSRDLGRSVGEVEE